MKRKKTIIMKRIKVSLTKIDDIMMFNKEINKLPCDMVVCKGRWRVDAKSLMGLFSLDLSEPIQIYFDPEHYDEVLEALGSWVIPFDSNDKVYQVE